MLILNNFHFRCCSNFVVFQFSSFYKYKDIKQNGEKYNTKTKKHYEWENTDHKNNEKQ